MKNVDEMCCLCFDTFGAKTFKDLIRDVIRIPLMMPRLKTIAAEDMFARFDHSSLNQIKDQFL